MKGRSVTPTPPQKPGASNNPAVATPGAKAPQPLKTPLNNAPRPFAKQPAEAAPKSGPPIRAKIEPQKPPNATARTSNLGGLAKKDGQNAKNYQSARPKTPDTGKERPQKTVAMSLNTHQFQKAKLEENKQNFIRAPEVDSEVPVENVAVEAPVISSAEETDLVAADGEGSLHEGDEHHQRFSPDPSRRQSLDTQVALDPNDSQLYNQTMRDSFKFSVKIENPDDLYMEIGELKDENGERKISVIGHLTPKNYLGTPADISALDPILTDRSHNDLADISRRFSLERVVEKDEDFSPTSLSRRDTPYHISPEDPELMLPTIAVKTPSMAVEDPTMKTISILEEPVSFEPSGGFRKAHPALRESEFKRAIDSRYLTAAPEVKSFVGGWLEAVLRKIVHNFDGNTMEKLENPDENALLLARYMNKDFRSKIRTRNVAKAPSSDSLSPPPTSTSRGVVSRVTRSPETAPTETTHSKKRSLILERTGNVLEMMSGMDFDLRTMDLSADNTFLNTRNSVSKKSPDDNQGDQLILVDIRQNLNGGSERRLEATPETDTSLLGPLERALSSKTRPIGAFQDAVQEEERLPLRGVSPDKLSDFPDQKSLTSFKKNVSMESTAPQTNRGLETPSWNEEYQYQEALAAPPQPLRAKPVLAQASNFAFQQKNAPKKPKKRSTYWFNFSYIQPRTPPKPLPSSQGRVISGAIQIIHAKAEGSSQQVIEPTSTITTLQRRISSSTDRPAFRHSNNDHKMQTERAILRQSKYSPFSGNTPDKLRSSVNLEHKSGGPSSARGSAEFGTSPQAQFANLCKKIIIYESKLEQLKESLFANDTLIIQKVASLYASDQGGVWQLTKLGLLLKDLGFHFTDKGVMQISSFISQIYRKVGDEGGPGGLLLPEFARFLLPKKQSAKVAAGWRHSAHDSHSSLALGEDEIRILKNIVVVLVRKIEDLARIARSTDPQLKVVMFESCQDGEELIGGDKVIAILGGFGMPVQTDHAFYVMREFGIPDHQVISKQRFLGFFELDAWHF